MSIAANINNNATPVVTETTVTAVTALAPWKNWDLSGSLLQITANFLKKGLDNPIERKGDKGECLVYPFHNGSLWLFGNGKAKIEIYPLGGKMEKSPEGEIVLQKGKPSKAEIIRFEDDDLDILKRVWKSLTDFKEVLSEGTKSPYSFKGLEALAAQEGCDKIKFEVWLDPSVAKRMIRGGAKASAFRLTVPTQELKTRIERVSLTKEGAAYTLSTLKMGAENPYLEWLEKAEGEGYDRIPTWVWEEETEDQTEDGNIFDLPSEVWERLYPAAKAARNLPSDSPQKWFYTIMGAAPKKVEEGYIYTLLRRQPELIGKIFDYLNTALAVGLKGVEPFVGSVAAPHRQCLLTDGDGKRLVESTLTEEQVQAWLSYHYGKITAPTKGGVLSFTPTTATDSPVVVAPVPVAEIEIEPPSVQTFTPTPTPIPTSTEEEEDSFFEGQEMEIDFNWDD